MEPFAPKLILVPTDFSEPAAHALRYASALAGRFGAHLLVIHADSFTPVVDFTAIPAAVFGDLQGSMIENAREVLQAHAEENIGAAVPFDLRVIVGNPLDAIAAQTAESGANLVVMGTHGRTGVSRLLFGSVTESVMRTSAVPVIAVNRGASEEAHVRRVLLVGRADERWVPRELGDRCEMKLTGAEDAQEIVHVARESGADLIVLSVEPGTTVYETLRGTLAERVVQQSSCAVLTMNEQAMVGVDAVTDHHAASLK